MNGIHPDFVLGVGHRVSFGHQSYRALGSVIRRHIRGTHQPVDRRQIDNATGAGRSHVRNGVFGAEEHPFHVDGLHPVPLFFGQLIGWLVGPGNARVVDDHIQFAEMTRDTVKGLFDLGFVGNVTVPVLHFVAFGGQFRYQRFSFIVQYVENADSRALLQHALDRGPANSQRTTRYRCYLAC